MFSLHPLLQLKINHVQLDQVRLHHAFLCVPFEPNDSFELKQQSQLVKLTLCVTSTCLTHSTHWSADDGLFLWRPCDTLLSACLIPFRWRNTCRTWATRSLAEASSTTSCETPTRDQWTESTPSESESGRATLHTEEQTSVFYLLWVVCCPFGSHYEWMSRVEFCMRVFVK